MNREEKLKRIVSDPLLWMRYFLQITDKTGRLVPFIPTHHQKVLLKNREKFNIVVKSRQLGISSILAGYILYIMHTEPNAACLMMSYSKETLDVVFDKLKFLYEHMDESVKIDAVRYSDKEIVLENGSSVRRSVCSNSDAARGATLRFVHITEVGFMDDRKLKNQLVALEASLRPDAEMFLESTAQGSGNYFFDLWMKAVSGESRYKPYFFSWLDDKYLFVDEYEENTKYYKKKYGRFLKFDDLETDEKILYDKMDGDNNPMALKKLMWRRVKISNSGLAKFQQEYPSTALEAFTVSGNNVFDMGKIQERVYHVSKTEELPLPDDSPQIMRKWKSGMKFWRYPVPDEKYFIGVDTGEGLGQDNSVISIMDQDGFQCFEFVSNRIKPYEYADLVRAVGIYYNQGLLVIEKASGGHTVVDKLSDSNHRYINLYKYKSYDVKGKIRKKAGFETTPKSRPIIINRFMELFETGEICVNSKELLNEMKVFQMDKSGKMQAVKGAKDDRVMSMCMALEGLASGIYYI